VSRCSTSIWLSLAMASLLSACARGTQSGPPTITIQPPTSTSVSSKGPPAEPDLVFRVIDLHNAAAFLAEVFGRTVVVTAKSRGCVSFETSSRSAADAFAALATATRTRIRETNGVLIVTDANAAAPAPMRTMPGADAPFDDQRRMDSGNEALSVVFKALGLALQGGDRVPGRVSLFAHGASARALVSVLLAESHTELDETSAPSVVRSQGFGYVGEKPPIYFVSCSSPSVKEGADLACARLHDVDVRAARLGGEHPLAMLFTKRFDARAVYLNGKTLSLGAIVGLDSEHRITAIDRSGVRLSPEPADEKPYEDVGRVSFATEEGPACALVPVKSDLPE
jgi:hypothetical protein